MTETASQQAERIFKKAAIIARFPFGDGWPEYFSHEQLAALMAGGPEDAHPVDFLYWRKVIADATGPAGSLKFKDEVSKTIEPVRWNLANERPTFAGMPARLVYMCQRTGETFSYCFIDREACTVWLRAIGETPNEYVLAWLGPAWTAPTENQKRQKLRALLQSIRGIDPTTMPGQKIDFHALAAAYDKGFVCASSTFSDYLDKPAARPKLCTFVRGGLRDPDFYRRAGIQIGVNEVDYNRTLRSLEAQKVRAKAKKSREDA